jgi:hypothetical protein
MACIAFFATEKPIPGQHYTGIPIAGKTIFIRTVDVSESGDPLDCFGEAELPNETLLNTYETDEPTAE